MYQVLFLSTPSKKIFSFLGDQIPSRIQIVNYLETPTESTKGVILVLLYLLFVEIRSTENGFEKWNSTVFTVIHFLYVVHADVELTAWTRTELNGNHKLLI